MRGAVEAVQRERYISTAAMITAIQLWDEPNNISHWDCTLDPEWQLFARMVEWAADGVHEEAPEMTVVLAGISPIDPAFLDLLLSHYGLAGHVDAVAAHGFPQDWQLWQFDDWPAQVESLRRVACGLPLWITATGCSSFGCEDVQVFGVQRTFELLRGRVERIFWYSLFDLPGSRMVVTRHRESEGSDYYRHFFTGLIREDGVPKPALAYLPPDAGVCQWVQFDERALVDALACWMNRLGLRRLRTNISWADWHRPDALRWFDYVLERLEPFDLTVTLCFTPPSRGIRPDPTSPPADPGEFAYFCREVVRRYVR